MSGYEVLVVALAASGCTLGLLVSYTRSRYPGPDERRPRACSLQDEPTEYDKQVQARGREVLEARRAAGKGRRG